MAQETYLYDKRGCPQQQPRLSPCLLRKALLTLRMQYTCDILYANPIYILYAHPVHIVYAIHF